MNYRRKLLLYLLLIHLFFAGLAVWSLLPHPIWLLGVEIVFLISLYSGIRLIRNLFAALDLVRSGTHFLSESDFAVRFRQTGQPEMDQLIRVYNRMADRLREERIHLQEQNCFLEKIVQTSPTGILILDFDGAVSVANPAAATLLASSIDSLRGKRLTEMSTPWAEAMSRLETGESRILSSSGMHRMRGFHGTFTDRGFSRSFYLLEELTEELRQTEKSAYEKLIRIMAHEVNNSTAATASLLESCLAYRDQVRLQDRQDFEEALQTVLSRIDQLNRFMAGFAEVARLPAPRRSPCDIGKILQETVLCMSVEAQKKEISWRWEVVDPYPMVVLDRIQMEQVFINLLKNAIEAIEHGGIITLRIGTPSPRLPVTVEDNGCGMSAETQANLFVPFFSTKPHGQGIGLTMVKEILLQHGFDFSLESQPGGPTRFTIFFDISTQT